MTRAGVRLVQLAGAILPASRTLGSGAVQRVLVHAGGGGLGDLLRAIPAFQSIRAAYPRARMTLLAAPGANEVLPLLPEPDLFSEILTYDPYGPHSGALAKLRLIHDLRRMHYDLVYFPGRGPGMRQEAVMAYLIGAPIRLGFSYGPVGNLFTTTTPLMPDRPILEQNLDVLRAAGLPTAIEKLVLRVPEQALRSAHEILCRTGIGDIRPLVLIHLGASWHGEYRRWPVERYAQVASAVADDFGAAVGVIGSHDERDLASSLVQRLRHPRIKSLAGETSLVDMAALLSASDLFVGHDSGPLHVAVALRTPSVAIFGSTDPRQVLSSFEGCIVVKNDHVTLPLYLHQHDFTFPADTNEYLEALGVEDVLEPIRQTLSNRCQALSTATGFAP